MMYTHPVIKCRELSLLLETQVRPPSALVEEPSNPGIKRRLITNLMPGTRYVVSIIGVTNRGRYSPPNTYELWSGKKFTSIYVYPIL